jgi:hypothetical protein
LDSLKSILDPTRTKVFIQPLCKKGITGSETLNKDILAVFSTLVNI